MTPELRTACEVVFQQHKTSPDPVNWNKDPFRGRVSMGLRDLAKDTLVRKNVIYFPNPQKKINTALNPAVTEADSYQEALEIIEVGAPAFATSFVESKPTYVAMPVKDVMHQPVRYTARVVSISSAELFIERPKWYMRPFFYYCVWPACAAVGGILIAYLINNARF